MLLCVSCRAVNYSTDLLKTNLPVFLSMGGTGSCFLLVLWLCIILLFLFFFYHILVKKDEFYFMNFMPRWFTRGIQRNYQSVSPVPATVKNTARGRIFRRCSLGSGRIALKRISWHRSFAATDARGAVILRHLRLSVVVPLIVTHSELSRGPDQYAALLSLSCLFTQPVIVTQVDELCHARKKHDWTMAHDWSTCFHNNCPSEGGQGAQLPAPNMSPPAIVWAPWLNL